MSRFAISSIFAVAAFAQEVHLDHVHLNTTNIAAARAYYDRHFLSGPIRFHEVATAPPSGLISAIWHIGWGAPDTRAEYQRQLKLGAKYSTPPTNIPEVGPQFFYSYVEGPDNVMIELNTAADAQFRHIHLLAEDPIAAAEWYMKHLGIKTLGGRPLSRRIVRLVDTDIGPTANLSIDNVYLGLFPASWAKTAYPDDWKEQSSLVTSAGRVVDHIAFRVTDLDGTLTRMRSEGVKVLDLPKRQGDGGKQAYIEGPDRILIELVQASN